MHGRKVLKTISTTTLAMTKSSVLFCSAQEGKSVDMNYSIKIANYYKSLLQARGVSLECYS